jgi:hypothetical protein
MAGAPARINVIAFDRSAMIAAFRRFSRDPESAVDQFIESGREVFGALSKFGLKDAIPPAGRRYSIPTDLSSLDKSSGMRIDHILANNGIDVVAGEGGAAGERRTSRAGAGGASYPAGADLDRLLPIDRPVLGHGDDGIKGETRETQHDDGRHHQRGLEKAARQLDQVADALLRSDELGDDHADSAERDRDFHCMRILREDLPGRAHERARHHVYLFLSAADASHFAYFALDSRARIMGCYFVAGAL